MVITLLQHIAKCRLLLTIITILAERTNGRAYATVFRVASVCRLSVTYLLWLNSASYSKSYY